MDSLDILINEESSNDDYQNELPAMQGVSGSAVGTVRGLDRHYNIKNGVMEADCGILDACGI
eukprot:12269484-Karenia_brevis.AAC.1